MKIRQQIKLTLAFTTLAFNTQSAELHVVIDEVKNNDGVILAQLFSGEDNFNKGQAITGTKLPAKKGIGELMFKDLVPGEYVVRLFHDENNNQKMEKNIFGMPKEGYGFSNEAVAHLGPPKYKDMVVQIEAKDASVRTKVIMKY